MEKIKEALDKAGALKRGEVSNPGNEINKVSKIESFHVPDKADFYDEEQKEISLNPDHLEKHRIVAHNKNNPLSSTFDRLRTLILHRMSLKKWKTLAIISPSPSAGKTVLAINLAMSVAQLQNLNVLLVDFDLRCPSVLNYLGVNPEHSLNEYIEEKCSFEEALVNPQFSNLSIIGGLEKIENSSEHLSSNKIKHFIDLTTSSINEGIVIFDLPPILNADDAIAILPKIDCALLVVSDGCYTEKELDECLQQIPGTKLVGTVLNKARDEQEPAPYNY